VKVAVVGDGAVIEHPSFHVTAGATYTIEDENGVSAEIRGQALIQAILEEMKAILIT
jgi:hypothetical protein